MSATLHKLELYYVSFLYIVNEKVPECFSSYFVRTFFIFFSESIFQRREILLKLVDFWFWLLAWEYPTYVQLSNAMENLSDSIAYTCIRTIHAELLQVPFLWNKLSVLMVLSHTQNKSCIYSAPTENIPVPGMIYIPPYCQKAIGVSYN